MTQRGMRQAAVLFIAYWQDPLMPDREIKVIPRYPQPSARQMTMRPYLHPLLQKITTVESGLIVITGEDRGDPFF